MKRKTSSVRIVGLSLVGALVGSMFLAGCSGTQEPDGPGGFNNGLITEAAPPSAVKVVEFAYVATTGATNGIDLFSIGNNGSIVGTAAPQATGGPVLGLTVTSTNFLVAVLGTETPALEVFSINTATGALTPVVQTQTQQTTLPIGSQPASPNNRYPSSAPTGTVQTVSVANAGGQITVDPTGTLGAVGVPSQDETQGFNLSGTGQITLLEPQVEGPQDSQFTSAVSAGQSVLVAGDASVAPNLNSFGLTAGVFGFLVTNTTPLDAVDFSAAVLADGSAGIAGTGLTTFANTVDQATTGNCFTFSLTGGTINFSSVVNTTVGNGTQILTSAAIATVPGLANPVGVFTSNLGTGGTNDVFAGTVTEGANGAFTTLASANVAGASASAIIVPTAAGAVPLVAVVGTNGLTPFTVGTAGGGLQVEQGTTVADTAPAQTSPNAIGIVAEAAQAK